MGGDPGNVLFARELIADVLEAGELRLIHGVWRWPGGVGPAPRIQEAIAGRLDGLTEPGRRFLELLSVGEPLGLGTAERVTADGVLIELERRGVIAVGDEDSPASDSVIRCSEKSSEPRCRRSCVGKPMSSWCRVMRSELERSPAELLKLAVLWQGSGERVDPFVLAEAAQVANQLVGPQPGRKARSGLVRTAKNILCPARARMVACAPASI